jgi:hypothetical protein
MQLLPITTCTDRKRFPFSAELDASKLPTGPQHAVLKTWQRRVSRAKAVGRAGDVYCGRSFQEAATAARAACSDLLIVSGGLGLISAHEEIASYSLSLVRQSPEYVGSRVTGAAFDPSLWWSEIQTDHNPAPLAKLLRTNRDAIVIFAISSTYLKLVSSDLISLGDDELERVRLIGMGIDAECPEKLRQCVLPYDSRLDGPDSELSGTRGDFSSRAMRHFIECVLADTKSKSLPTHRDAVTRSLSKWRPPRVISRPQRSDEEIVRLIKRNWKAIEGKSGRGLRYLRDVEKIACEQNRYRDLFRRAAKEVL